METPIGPMGLRHSLRAPLAAGLRRTIGQIGVSIRGQASIGLTSQHSSAVAEQESDQSEFFFLPGPPLHKAEMRPFRTAVKSRVCFLRTERVKRAA